MKKLSLVLISTLLLTLLYQCKVNKQAIEQKPVLAKVEEVNVIVQDSIEPAVDTSSRNSTLQTVSFPEIHFDSGSYKIKASEFGKLDTIARFMKQNPEVSLVANGYSGLPAEDGKDRLSYLRARTAIGHMIGKYGIEKERFILHWKVRSASNQGVGFRLAALDEPSMNPPRRVPPRRPQANLPGRPTRPTKDRVPPRTTTQSNRPTRPTRPTRLPPGTTTYNLPTRPTRLPPNTGTGQSNPIHSKNDSTTPEDPTHLPEDIDHTSESNEAVLEAELDQAVNAGLNQVAKGTYKYDSIPPLPVDTNYTFRLEIILGSDTSLFRPRKDATTGSVTGEIEVGSEMSVNITSPDTAFQITLLSAEVQPIHAHSSTEWSWSIIPKKTGKHKVFVRIDIFTKSTLLNKVIKRTHPVHEQVVEVYVIEKPEPTPPKNNWLLWVLPGVLLIGILIFALLRRQKKRKQEKQWLVSPDLWKFLTEVENEIAEGNTEEAIDKLMTFFNGKDNALHSDLLVLSAEYKKYKRSYNMGLNPPEETVNRINLAIVEMVNDLQAKVQKA